MEAFAVCAKTEATRVFRRSESGVFILPSIVCAKKRSRKHLTRSANEAASSSCTNRVCATPSPKKPTDRKSTRLNSSHSQISYAVFCLKKKKNNKVSHSLNQ